MDENTPRWLSTRRTPGVVYTTAEQFTSEFVSAMRNGRSEDWQRRYRGRIGLLIVEDVQHLRGREKTQLELFHTVQHVLDAGGRVLLTGDRAPRDLTGLDERVRSQVARGFVAELEPHFLDEERWLLPALENAGEHALVARTLDEHRRLRSLAAALAAGDLEPLAEFAGMLSAHVRFEERELFERAQQVIPADELGRLAARDC